MISVTLLLFTCMKCEPNSNFQRHRCLLADHHSCFSLVDPISTSPVQSHYIILSCCVPTVAPRFVDLSTPSCQNISNNEDNLKPLQIVSCYLISSSRIGSSPPFQISLHILLQLRPKVICIEFVCVRSEFTEPICSQ